MTPFDNPLFSIGDSFDILGRLLSIEPIGQGHIHQTFLVHTDSNDYVLQRINPRLFPNPDLLMANFRAVSDHLRHKVLLRNGNPTRECLSLILTREGKSFFTGADAAWRMFPFLTDSVCHQRPDQNGLFRESGVAFGEFITDLADFDPGRLHILLPGFHDTPARYRQFEEAVRRDPAGRVALLDEEIAFASGHESLSHGIAEALQTGIIPWRVTHNDAKLNNVLFDAFTHQHLAVIDFDTIMPGTPCHDFGDAIRFGCNTASEDETDVSQVHFSLSLFQAFAEGYLQGIQTVLSPAERDFLALGALSITYENGLRFLADYIHGDPYYHIDRPNHNLDRCRTQFRLVEEMIDRFQQMETIIQHLANPISHP